LSNHEENTHKQHEHWIADIFRTHISNIKLIFIERIICVFGKVIV
jgi:hypothetical protein